MWAAPSLARSAASAAHLALDMWAVPSLARATASAADAALDTWAVPSLARAAASAADVALDTWAVPSLARAAASAAGLALDTLATPSPAHAAALADASQAQADQLASADTPLESAPLYDRITLLDAQHRYLAGAPLGDAPSAERALTVDGQTVGYLAVTRPLRPDDAPALAFLGQLKQSLLAIVAASVALSALAAIALAAHFRRPIRALAGGARALEQGQFDTRLPVNRSDELGELAASFNRLAERLQAVEHSRRQWVADTSHELRTPLAVLRAQIEAVQDGVRPADPATIAAMLRQVLALNRLIDELYTLARADVGELDIQRMPVDLWQLAQEEAAAFAPRLAAAGLHCDLSPTRAAGTSALTGGPAAEAAAPAVIVSGDPDRLRQVLRNLLENSLRYTASGGNVRLSAAPAATGGRVQLHFDDSAPGVPDDALPRLAERFYRVDRSRSRQDGGAGLGLALCERIVTAHGGRLLFAHSPLGGLRVTLDLPRST
jgi:two-component system sensor histidine kinase BaeS